MNKDLIDKIKSRGYWRINFQPVVDKKKISSLGECKEIIEKNRVALRGWDYPHFPQRTGNDTGLEPAESHYVGWIDWNNHKEFWHMYQSGQFLHYIALREDWLEEDTWNPNLAEKIKTGSSLGIIGSVVFQMTEIFEFLARLGSAEIYDEGVTISISLNNTQNRELWVEDKMRAPLFSQYKTGADNIGYSNEYSKEQIITSSKDLAIEAIIYIFDHFGWHTPPIETIKRDQENLLARRF